MYNKNRGTKNKTRQCGINNKGEVRKKLPPKKKLKRRAKTIIFYLTIWLIVLFVGLILSLTVLFKIEKIEVLGDTKYDNNDIMRLCEASKGQNLLLYDVDTCILNIEREMPYINTIKVSKIIPNKIRIEVADGDPVGQAEMDNGYVLISPSGRVMDAVSEKRKDVINIRGLNLRDVEISQEIKCGADGLFYILMSIMDEVRDNGLKGINEIDLSNTASISLKYEDRINIILGVPDNLGFKIRTAAKILDSSIGRNERGTLNLASCQEDNRSYFLPETI